MKSKTLKTVVVKCFNWEDEIEVNADVFDDVLMEAATRAVEKRKNLEGFKVAVVIECYEKKLVEDPDKHFMYNTYFVLINAGIHEKAEILRLNFLKMHKIDLQKESLKGGDNGSRPNSKSN
jgi:hypothetical protein